MCGIAGIIHRNRSGGVGGEMTAMLQALKHRGPDSTGYAVYSQGGDPADYIMRIKVAEADDLAIGHGAHRLIVDRRCAMFCPMTAIPPPWLDISRKMEGPRS